MLVYAAAAAMQAPRAAARTFPMHRFCQNHPQYVKRDNTTRFAGHHMRSRNPAENRIFTGLRLPPKLLARLDDYCLKQKIHPHRTRVIEVAIAEFLERENPQSPSA